MNFDFKLKMSGKIARRIAYLHRIMKVDIDPRILDYVDRDLLTKEQVTQVFGHPIDDINLKVVQFAADSDFRCVIVAYTMFELQEQMLMAAMASGSKIVIYDSDFNSVKWGWKKTLIARCLPYKIVNENTRDLDDKCAIWVIEKPNDAREILKKNRDRIFLFAHGANNTSNVNLPQLFSSDVELSTSDLAREFPKMIAGFHLESNLGNASWPSSVGFREVVNMVNCQGNVATMLSYSTQAQSTLVDGGFVLRSPGHIGRVLNVNTDLIHRDKPLETEYAE